jgi:glutathione S-transferase
MCARQGLGAVVRPLDAPLRLADSAANPGGATMKLYTSPVSPFSERVRLALAYKKVPYEPVEMTPDQVHAPEFRKVNPIGKIPVLITDEGQTILESETILDYVEDAFPQPSLRLKGAGDLARMRTAIRVFENYVGPPLFRLFEQVDPAARKDAVVADEIARWRRGLALLAGVVDDARFAVAGTFSLADCAVFPGLVLCNMIAPVFQAGDLVSEQPRLAGYFAKARADPMLGKSHDDMMAAVAAMYA